MLLAAVTNRVPLEVGAVAHLVEGERPVAPGGAEGEVDHVEALLDRPAETGQEGGRLAGQAGAQHAHAGEARLGGEAVDDAGARRAVPEGVVVRPGRQHGLALVVEGHGDAAVAVDAVARGRDGPPRSRCRRRRPAPPSRWRRPRPTRARGRRCGPRRAAGGPRTRGSTRVAGPAGLTRCSSGRTGRTRWRRGGVSHAPGSPRPASPPARTPPGRPRPGGGARRRARPARGPPRRLRRTRWRRRRCRRAAWPAPRRRT